MKAINANVPDWLTIPVKQSHYVPLHNTAVIQIQHFCKNMNAFAAVAHLELCHHVIEWRNPEFYCLYKVMHDTGKAMKVQV